MAECPPSWPLLVGAVVVDAKVAPVLVSLLAAGRRRAASDQWRLPEPVEATLRALDQLAAAQTNGPDVLRRPAPVWVPTSEAACKLKVSERRVRQLVAEGQLAGRKISGKLLVDAADLDAFANARAEVSGSASETDASGLCA